ncbi:MAG: YIP1 family protein [Anaerolineae bacterium]|nr:YIP1 family protein [Gemmatimonadaceae bacterium]
MARSITDRMRGAAMLDVATYEEVEADTTATGQAAIVVGIVAVCAAIGGVRGGASGAIAGVLGAFFSWMIWAGVTFVVGEKMFGGTATWGELLRTLGFAQAPGVLYLLGIIPVLGTMVQFAVAIWIMVAGVIAIRQALDFTTGKAVITAIVAFLVVLVVSGIMAGIFGLGRAIF